MSGEWIKLELVTPDKPEVFAIADILNIDPDSVTGKLVRIWVWADTQTINGNAKYVTRMLLDRITYTTGFADAMLQVGWLSEDEGGLKFVNFDRHNGKGAKKRAEGNRRTALSRSKAKERLESDYKCNTNSVTKELQKALPEKRREEKSNKERKSSIAGSKKEIPIEFDFEEVKFKNITQKNLDVWGESYPAVDLIDEIRGMASWLDANPKNKKSNYKRFINNWLKRSQDRARAQGSQDGTSKQINQQARSKNQELDHSDESWLDEIDD